VRNGKNTTFQCGAEDILSYDTVGVYLSGFKFGQAASQIPSNLVYIYKGKSYLTNVCIDGHMVWIKNPNEIKLKAVSDVPCTVLMLEQLGCTVEHISKASVDQLLRIEGVLQNRMSGFKTLATPESVISDKLKNELQYLKSKLIKPQMVIQQCEQECLKAKNDYEYALSTLNRSYKSGYLHYSLQDLINAGKVKPDKYGAYALVEKSRVPTYYTEEDAVRLENTQTPDRDADIVSHYRYDNPGFNDDYVVAHHYKKEVAHEDMLFLSAREWCSSSHYIGLHNRVVSAYNSLISAKAKYDDMVVKSKAYIRSSEYLELRAQYEELRSKLAEQGYR